MEEIDLDSWLASGITVNLETSLFHKNEESLERHLADHHCTSKKSIGQTAQEFLWAPTCETELQENTMRKIHVDEFHIPKLYARTTNSKVKDRKKKSMDSPEMMWGSNRMDWSAALVARNKFSTASDLMMLAAEDKSTDLIFSVCLFCLLQRKYTYNCCNL